MVDIDLGTASGLLASFYNHVAHSQRRHASTCLINRVIGKVALVLKRACPSFRITDLSGLGMQHPFESFSGCQFNVHSGTDSAARPSRFSYSLQPQVWQC
jgi:hypothetical protein